MREPGLQAQRQLLSPCAVAPQRCRIGRGDRDVETGARTGPIRQMRRALHAGGKPARRNLRVDVEVAERTPAQHETGASGTFLQIDPAPEPQQPSKLRPLVGREISLELEFERIGLERIAGRLGDEVNPRRAGFPIDRKLGNRTLAGFIKAIHREDGANIERRKMSDGRADGFPDPWLSLAATAASPSSAPAFNSRLMVP